MLSAVYIKQSYTLILWIFGIRERHIHTRKPLCKPAISLRVCREGKALMYLCCACLCQLFSPFSSAPVSLNAIPIFKHYGSIDIRESDPELSSIILISFCKVVFCGTWGSGHCGLIYLCTPPPQRKVRLFSLPFIRPHSPLKVSPSFQPRSPSIPLQP